MRSFLQAVRCGARCGAGVVLTILAACSGGESTTESPVEQLVMSILEGNNQVVTVGSAVALAPAVQVRTDDGTAKAGVSVTFAVTSGGGAVTGATQTTDANGIARVGSWTVGNTAGANGLSASATNVTGSPAAFVATGTAGPAAMITKVGGDNQTATVGSAVGVAPSVRVTDQFNNPVSGSEVTFAVTLGGGQVTNGTVTTGADGLAAVGAWVLGQTAGANALAASAAGSGIVGNPAAFAATATAGAPTEMTKVAGDNQTAAPGATLPIYPSVRLADLFGNPVSGRAVAFAITGGGGTLTGANPMTGADGTATLGSWTLGGAPGPNTMSASHGSLNVTFTATGAAPFNPAPYAGTYSGNWTNQTFGSIGTGTVTISVDQNAMTATVTGSATGNVLGSGAPAPITRTGAYGATSAMFNDMLPVMGTVSGTIDANGNLVLAGTNIPDASIARWDATGTITPTQIQLAFTVTFTAGPPANGTITLNRQ